MRRLARFDWLLLGVLLPTWAVVFVLHVRAAFEDGLREPPVLASPPAASGGYPTVGGFRLDLESRETGVELGDRILRVGSRDASGLGYLGFHAVAVGEAGSDLRVPLSIERDGVRSEVLLELVGPPLPWVRIPMLVLSVLTALVILMRAPDVRRARIYFAALLMLMLFQTPFPGGSTAQTLAHLLVFNGVGGLALALAGVAAVSFPEEMPAAQRLRLRWAWLFGLLWYVPRLLFVLGWPVPTRMLPIVAAGSDALYLAFLIAVYSRNYRAAAPIGRRRLRWVALGFYAGILPVVALSAGPVFDPAARWLPEMQALSFLTMTLLPLTILIAIVRFNYFDIDRILSQAATLTVLGALLVGGLLVVMPGLAAALARSSGLATGPAQLITSLGLAALVAGLGLRLRPVVDRMLFAERRSFERGVQRLMRDLSATDGLRELVALLGERLAAIVRPVGLAVYAPAGTERPRFDPVLVRELGAAPRFSARSPLLDALAGRDGPLLVEDRGALGALDAELLIPVQRGAVLALFVALGRKRSGDVYTPTEVALLGALAEKTSAELHRFETAELLRQGGEMMEVLRREKAEADRANEEKTAFLAAASHDLRQPVHALGLLIGALAERIERGPGAVAPDPQLRRLVERIEDSNDSVQRMLHSLLDLSKLDAGVVESEPRDFALGPLLAELAEEFRETAEGRGLRFDVVNTRCWVRSDPLLLRRIVQNLIANAVRYTKRGGVVVGCRRRSGELRIAVCDTGPGIEAAERERIFREYERSRTRDPSEAEGLGLGLAIVRRLGALLGHRVTLESLPGRGSSFAVDVPRAEARVPLPRVVRRGTPADLAGLRVLLVDDDRAVRDGMRALLEPWGCRVLASGSLAGVRRSLAEPGGEVDVILADYHLADSETGVDAIRFVRERTRRDVPALLMTGDASVPRANEGGVPVLTKPVSPAQLRAALAQLVRGKSALRSR